MKVKTRYAKVKFHRYIENGDIINREDSEFPVYGNRLTEAGCRNKTPDGCFFDGYEIVVETYEIDESVIRMHGTLVAKNEEVGE